MPKPFPSTSPKHPAAVALGKLGKGQPKTMTPAAIEARRQTARTRRKPAKTPPLSDAEVQLPPGPLGTRGDEDEVD